MSAKLSIAECDRILTAKGSVLEVEELFLNERKVRTWKHCPRTFRSFLLDSVQTYSSRIFLSSPTVSENARTGRRHVTYGEVLQLALRQAAWMRSKGLGMGSRIAMGGGNCTEWIVAFVATHLIGGITVLLNSWLPRHQLLHCLKTTRPHLILVDLRCAEDLSSCADDLKVAGTGEVFCWSSIAHLPEHSRHDIQDLQSSLANRQLDPGQILDENHVLDLGPESDATIFFSSGTSGLPKAVLSTQRMALTNLWSGLVAPARASLRASLPMPPLPKSTDPQRTVLLSIPLFHVTGCLSWLMRAFFAGSKMVLLPRWNVSEAVRLIQAESVTVIGGVPAVVAAILQSPDLPRDKSFETVFYGGAPPSKQLAAEVKTRWPKAGLVQGYGLTETNAYVCSVAGLDYVARPDSTGPPVPICDTLIVDPSSREPVSPGTIGLLLVRGPQVMECYYNDPVATDSAIDKNGWLDTGDMARVDEEGFIYIKDRLKDVIIRGGENIASADVENALYAHPAVSEAAALGVPDDMLGEKVGAIVSLRPGFSSAQLREVDLIDFVRPLLARHAVPSIILISDQALPRNVNGKLVKRDLKPLLVDKWDRAGRRDAAGPVKSKL